MQKNILVSTISLPLYEQISSEITHQIQTNLYKPGDRLPSVRWLSQQKGVSISTVLQAYKNLEDAGAIESRPQSGYYVRLQQPSLLICPEPEMSTPPSSPERVQVTDLVMQVLQDASNSRLVQFGAALPAADLLPLARINRILVNLCRSNRVAPNTFSSPEGYIELRKQIAKRIYFSGCSLTPDDIIITSGCTEAISLALRSICKPGEIVAIESPTYFVTLQMIEAQGLQALEIPTHHRDGISLEALGFALDHYPIKVVVASTNFNNPLGSCMPDEKKLALVKLLGDHDVPLIEDDVYGELYFGDHRPTVAKKFDKMDRVLLCSSFSKDISPGFRVGWITPGRYKNEFLRQKMATNVSTVLLLQYTIADFLECGGYDHHLRRIRRAYAQKMVMMSQAVLEHFPEGTRITSPSGGQVLWVQLPEGVDSLSLYRRALKAGITLAPGYIFSAGPRYRNFIRLNAAYMSSATSQAIQTLGKLAENELK